MTREIPKDAKLTRRVRNWIRKAPGVQEIRCLVVHNLVRDILLEAVEMIDLPQMRSLG